MALNDPDVKWPNSEVSTFLFRNLLKNEGFTNRFLERYTEILYTKLTKVSDADKDFLRLKTRMGSKCQGILIGGISKQHECLGKILMREDF